MIEACSDVDLEPGGIFLGADGMIESMLFAGYLGFVVYIIFKLSRKAFQSGASERLGFFEFKD
jgi:hypothetical protein